jgi:hypothetical protein
VREIQADLSKFPSIFNGKTGRRHASKHAAHLLDCARAL